MSVLVDCRQARRFKFCQSVGPVLVMSRVASCCVWLVLASVSCADLGRLALCWSGVGFRAGEKGGLDPT